MTGSAIIAARLTLLFGALLLTWWIYTGIYTLGPVDSHVCTQPGPTCSHKWDNWKIVE